MTLEDLLQLLSSGSILNLRKYSQHQHLQATVAVQIIFTDFHFPIKYSGYNQGLQ